MGNYSFPHIHIQFFKAAIINIFILTMNQMAIWDVKGAACSDKSTFSILKLNVEVLKPQLALISFVS